MKLALLFAIVIGAIGCSDLVSQCLAFCEADLSTIFCEDGSCVDAGVAPLDAGMTD